MGLLYFDLNRSRGSELIDAKIRKISQELASNNDGTARQSKSQVNKKERELIILKRQKKAMTDDVDEALQRYPTIEDAYSSALLTKAISPSNKQRRKVHEPSLFAKGVQSYYNSVRRSTSSKDYYGNYEVEKYCHFGGWLPGMSIKCFHLVPKSLESDGIAYLLGVREADLSEPRNGIALNISNYTDLNNGRIVIVPDKPKNGEEAIWRFLQVHKLLPSGQKDIDGKVLEFLSPNQPARRYLYLRYVMTFLQQQRLGNVDWLDFVKARGNVWGLPGPYLRKSMLFALARRVLGQDLPEYFYDSTFTVADGCPQRSDEDEDDLAMALDYKMQCDYADITKSDEEWSSDDAWSDDSDTDEEANGGFGKYGHSPRSRTSDTGGIVE
ncbi:hypothetical protein V490_01079 [Pseudogymnoascus sp. VKM F-3557]|nr:hypothetical protein V490_01079 [Pseudogymnoascus sp. VKM F-3557]